MGWVQIDNGAASGPQQIMRTAKQTHCALFCQGRKEIKRTSCKGNQCMKVVNGKGKGSETWLMTYNLELIDRINHYKKHQGIKI